MTDLELDETEIKSTHLLLTKEEIDLIFQKLKDDATLITIPNYFEVCVFKKYRKQLFNHLLSKIYEKHPETTLLKTNKILSTYFYSKTNQFLNNKIKEKQAFSKLTPFQRQAIKDLAYKVSGWSPSYQINIISILMHLKYSDDLLDYVLFDLRNKNNGYINYILQKIRSNFEPTLQNVSKYQDFVNHCHPIIKDCKWATIHFSFIDALNGDSFSTIRSKLIYCLRTKKDWFFYSSMGEFFNKKLDFVHQYNFTHRLTSACTLVDGIKGKSYTYRQRLFTLINYIDKWFAIIEKYKTKHKEFLIENSLIDITTSKNIYELVKNIKFNIGVLEFTSGEKYA